MWRRIYRGIRRRQRQQQPAGERAGLGWFLVLASGRVRGRAYLGTLPFLDLRIQAELFLLFFQLDCNCSSNCNSSC